MREIKFRAYLDADKKMYNVLSLSKRFPNEDFERIFIDKMGKVGEPSNYRVGDNVHLMQFTGLLDKNGKEIFEGDIVKSLLKSRMKPEGKYVAQTIQWQEDEMSDDSWGTIIVGYKTPMGSDWEIIGNIYTNPTLLTQ